MDTQRMLAPLGDALDFGGSGTYRTQAEKVAILLASLENTIAVDLLKQFAPEDVKQIVASSGNLGTLKNGDVAPLIDEFTAQFAEALGISAGSKEIISLLESAFPASQLAKMMGKEVIEEGEKVWPKFKTGAEENLVPYLLDEGEQTVALVLSKLAPDLAAKCIALLPRGVSKNVVSRMLGLNDATPLAVKALEEVLAEDFFTKAGTTDRGPKIDKMAAVVNKLDREQSTNLLEDLGQTNPDDTKLLRRLIFMFEDVERLTPKDRTKLMDKVPAELVIPALFSASDALKEGILSSLSARGRRMVESELQGDTSQPRKDTAPARRKIADMAAQMVRNGDIVPPVYNPLAEADEEAAKAAATEGAAPAADASQ
ncbi:FliG C-terminal domain-containing protein [Aestuariivirga litoralis]|uniref:FliG C-terminal domain-containing protein n=1 Tax=Aestuariivirga litoralis TaxID=2650924 RepID=UPI0018C503F3|nr:FliG C-terminal domain-containing protein [Aestuariivirga litoralis]MBG1233201.1 flagellar motor switch protein FliG [Aestuariivirga litoralis]